MKKTWYYKTSIGVFVIAEKNGRYYAIFEGESLENYSQPWMAAESLSFGIPFGRTFPNEKTISNTSELGIPDSLDMWDTD